MDTFFRDLGGEEAVGRRDNRPAHPGSDGPHRRPDAQEELRRHQRRGWSQLGGGSEFEPRQDEPDLAHRQLHAQAPELPLRL